MSHRSVPAGFFDRLYQQNPDPWSFASSAYEREKYAASLAALAPRRFAAALEVGCSIGVLTRALAERCETVVGVDVAEAALAAARARCADLAQVRFMRMEVPAAWPEGQFDLIVLSEVLYFLTADGVRGLADRVRGALEPGGQVLLVNWLGSTGTALPGEAAADLFVAASAPFLRPGLHSTRERYRLDVLNG